MDQSRWSTQRSIILAILFVGVCGEPVFFYGRGKEISRKRSFHPFSPRAPTHRPPTPMNRVPCAPNFAPRTKYVTKTTSLYKTIYETEFFPKTVFDTSFKTAPFDLEPSTITKTSTTTSTVLKTKVEPVYVTTTEMETTSLTSTVTHLVYDTMQHISSLLHTRLAPEVLTQTVVQDVYHTDVETIFSSRTITVTRTESIVNTDCPALPSSSSGRPFLGSQFDPRGKFNHEYLRAAFVHGPRDADPYIEIAHANSEPPKTFAGPIPFNDLNGKGTFHALHLGTKSHFSHVDPLPFQLHPPPSYAAFPFPENKLLNSFSSSDPNSDYYQSYLVDGDYSSRHHSVAKLPIAYPNNDETDDYVAFKSIDSKFVPSRPDPTSISDIIEASGSEELKDDLSYLARQPKQLKVNKESLYGTKSIYSSKLNDYSKPLISDSLHIDDYSDYDGEIHIKEVLKGVKGGEIYEEVHKHGIVEHALPEPITSVLNQHGSHNSKHSESYHDGPPVYEYKSRDPHYSTFQTRKSTSLLSAQYDPLYKRVHPLVPKQIEFNGSAKSPSESIGREVFSKSRVAADISPNHNALSPSVSRPHHPRTLFRSDVQESKRIDPEGRSHSFYEAYGAHSMPIVTNLAGTKFLDLYKNTSSNTYNPSKLSVPNTNDSVEQMPLNLEVGGTSAPIDSERSSRENPRISNSRSKNDWIPLVPFESLRANNDLPSTAPRTFSQ